MLISNPIIHLPSNRTPSSVILYYQWLLADLPWSLKREEWTFDLMDTSIIIVKQTIRGHCVPRNTTLGTLPLNTIQGHCPRTLEKYLQSDTNLVSHPSCDGHTSSCESDNMRNKVHKTLANVEILTWIFCVYDRSLTLYYTSYLKHSLPQETLLSRSFLSTYRGC